jgi:hypothetical protein
MTDDNKKEPFPGTGINLTPIKPKRRPATPGLGDAVAADVVAGKMGIDDPEALWTDGLDGSKDKGRKGR